MAISSVQNPYLCNNEFYLPLESDSNVSVSVSVVYWKLAQSLRVGVLRCFSSTNLIYCS